MPPTFQQKKFRAEVPKGFHLLAIMHVHPNTTARPSSADDDNAMSREDLVDRYTIARDGVFLHKGTRLSNNTFEKIYDSNWLNAQVFLVFASVFSPFF